MVDNNVTIVFLFTIRTLLAHWYTDKGQCNCAFRDSGPSQLRTITLLVHNSLMMLSHNQTRHLNNQHSKEWRSSKIVPVCDKKKFVVVVVDVVVVVAAAAVYA